ncbi:hypothetical protein TRVA0_035S01112 [Trichomonascus vanleenenianus]|uniref:uncharacterized protein n=1 Tax=Trichomonascus vanleenenianus TaxID=2268995 RepID=UPI003ECAF778
MTMTLRFDKDTLQQLNRVHRSYKAFVAYGPYLKAEDLHYAYGLFLQSSFGDYMTHNSSECVRIKCLNLRLLSPEPFFRDWMDLAGVDAEIASEEFNEFMSHVAMEFSKHHKLR